MHHPATLQYIANVCTFVQNRLNSIVLNVYSCQRGSEQGKQLLGTGFGAGENIFIYI